MFVSLSAIRQSLPRQTSNIRLLATAVVNPATSSSGPVTANPTLVAQGSRLRPPSGVETSPNHGLWAFFRKARDEKLLTLEPAHKSEDFSGRAWEAAELRRKNFKDLHTLWYVCVRERNLLATQRAEFRRLRIELSPQLTGLMDKDRRVRKTMKHIKLVLNERRLAFEQANELARGLAKESATTSDPSANASLEQGKPINA